MSTTGLQVIESYNAHLRTHAEKSTAWVDAWRDAHLPRLAPDTAHACLIAGLSAFQPYTKRSW